MIIETETKLDFNDVLIRPKRSTLKSVQKSRWNARFHLNMSPTIHGKAYRLWYRIWIQPEHLKWRML